MPSLQIPFFADATVPVRIPIREAVQTLTPSTTGGAPRVVITIALAAFVLQKRPAVEANGEGLIHLGDLPMLRMTAGNGVSRIVPLSSELNESGDMLSSLRLSSLGDVNAFLTAGNLEIAFDPWTLPPIAIASDAIPEAEITDWARGRSNLFANDYREPFFIAVPPAGQPPRIGALVGSHMHRIIYYGGIEDANQPAASPSGYAGLVISAVDPQQVRLPDTSLVGRAYARSPFDRLNCTNNRAAVGVRLNPNPATFQTRPTQAGLVRLYEVAEVRLMQDGSVGFPIQWLLDLEAYLAANRTRGFVPVALAPRRAATGTSGLLTVSVSAA